MKLWLSSFFVEVKLIGKRSPAPLAAVQANGRIILDQLENERHRRWMTLIVSDSIFSAIPELRSMSVDQYPGRWSYLAGDTATRCNCSRRTKEHFLPSDQIHRPIRYQSNSEPSGPSKNSLHLQDGLFGGFKDNWALILDRHRDLIDASFPNTFQILDALDAGATYEEIKSRLFGNRRGAKDRLRKQARAAREFRDNGYKDLVFWGTLLPKMQKDWRWGQPANTKRLPILHGDGLGLLGLPALDRLPLEEAVHWGDAARSAIGIAEGQQLLHGLAVANCPAFGRASEKTLRNLASSSGCCRSVVHLKGKG
jgi:hypothetical protein